jgi:hypothetical protein
MLWPARRSDHDRRRCAEDKLRDPGAVIANGNLERRQRCAFGLDRRHVAHEIDWQIGVVGRLASHLDSFLQGDTGRIGDGATKLERGRLKGRLTRRADATNTDFGTERKRLGMRLRKPLGRLCHRSLHFARQC